MSTDQTGPGRTDRAPLPPINFRALADALLAIAGTLVPQWLHDGTQRGHEWVCGSLSGGSGTSCSVNLTTGAWADFATGEQGGDLLSLYAAIHGLSMGKAAVQVARDMGLESVAGVLPERAAPGAAPRPVPAPRPAPVAAPVQQREDEGWQPVYPVPDMAPEATFKHFHRRAEDIDHVAAYMLDGERLGYVVRFRTSDGGKDTLPLTWCVSARDGAAKWVWKTWAEPRPLYFPAGRLPEGRTVVLVEGEKKAGLLQDLLETAAPGIYCVASWPGGCKAWQKAEWSWLAGSAVLLWPDCDAKREPLTPTEKKALGNDPVALAVAKAAKPLLPEAQQPGMRAMLGIGALLRDTHGCQVQMLRIPEPGTVPDGWDCGDAIAADGWDYSRVAALFGSAHALPSTDAIAGAGGPSGAAAGASGGAASGGADGARRDGKKRDGPASADGADSVDGAGPYSGKPFPWWLRPYWDADKCRWLVSRKLVISALEQDEALAPVLGLNLLSNNIEARTAWPWAHGKAGPITGTVDLMLGQYLSDTYGLSSIPRASLMEAIETVAHGRPFHPIVEFLQGLRWDGQARLDKWLIHAIGETPESLGPVKAEYLRLVGRYWLMGMVKRVLEPGCKFDYCVVLEGPGGLGKSTLVETLAGSQYFSDTHFDVARGKEGQEQVQGLWVYEIAELAGFGKAEVQLIKAFITAKVDRYRPSYGRVVESYPRQCLLVGTTNESSYLRDRTGNRRFWPVAVRARINNPWVAKVREQLLAEAYEQVQAGEPYTPDYKTEERLFAPMQESRMVDTAVMSELLQVLTRPPSDIGAQAVVNELTEFVTLSQLTVALGVDAAKSSPALEAQIRSWMDHEGWKRVKRQINGARHWGYERPSGWPATGPDPDDTLTAPGAARPSGEEQLDAQEAEDAPF